MLANGWNIEDFGKPDQLGQKPAIPIQAGYAEALAGIMQLALQDALSEEGLADAVAQIPVPAGAEAPQLSAQQFRTIRTRLELLLEEWQDLPPGATLEVPFPV